MPCLSASLAIDTSGSQARAASRRFKSMGWFGKPLRRARLIASVAKVAPARGLVGATLDQRSISEKTVTAGGLSLIFRKRAGTINESLLNIAVRSVAL